MVENSIGFVGEFVRDSLGVDGEVGFQLDVLEVFVDEVLADFGDGAEGNSRVRAISLFGDVGASGEDDFAGFVEGAFVGDEENAEENGERDDEEGDDDCEEVGFGARGCFGGVGFRAVVCAGIICGCVVGVFDNFWGFGLCCIRVFVLGLV